MEELSKLKMERIKYFVGGGVLGILLGFAIFSGLSKGGARDKKITTNVYTLKIDATVLRSMLAHDNFDNLKFDFKSIGVGRMLTLMPYNQQTPIPIGSLFSSNNAQLLTFDDAPASIFDYPGTAPNNFQQIIDLAHLEHDGVAYLILTPQVKTYSSDPQNLTWLYYSITAFGSDNTPIQTPSSDNRLWSLDPVPPAHPY